MGKQGRRASREVDQLALDAQQGNEEALTRLFDMIDNFIYKEAITWLKDNRNLECRLTKDELVSTARVLIWQYWLPRYDPTRASFLTFLRGVMRRRWINVGISASADYNRIQRYAVEHHLSEWGSIQETAGLRLDDQENKLQSIESSDNAETCDKLGKLEKAHKSNTISCRELKEKIINVRANIDLDSLLEACPTCTQPCPLFVSHASAPEPQEPDAAPS